MTESVLELFCGGWLRRTSHVALVIEDIACSWLKPQSVTNKRLGPCCKAEGEHVCGPTDSHVGYAYVSCTIEVPPSGRVSPGRE